MKPPDGEIEGTAREDTTDAVKGQRAGVRVRRPSLSIFARRLQATASANEMTEEIHRKLMGSLKDGG
jgi:hypothetical protein